jgi:hypothetical protein
MLPKSSIKATITVLLGFKRQTAHQLKFFFFFFFFFFFLLLLFYFIIIIIFFFSVTLFIGLRLKRTWALISRLFISSFFFSSFFGGVKIQTLRVRLVHCNDYYTVIRISITRNRISCNRITITIHQFDNNT